MHAAQGITVDSAHLVTDGSVDAAGLYVALTRGRLRNTAHVITTPSDKDLHEAAGGAAARPSPRAVLEGSLERDSSTRAALVERERDLEQLSSMTRLGPRLEAVIGVACKERMFRHLDELVTSGDLPPEVRARLSDGDGVDALSQLLRADEQAGRDPRETLRAAVTAPRGLGDADSIAQVLHHRITAGSPFPRPIPAETITAPGDIAPAAADHIGLVIKRIEARRDTLATQVAEQQPAWAVEALGPLPADTSDAADTADSVGGQSSQAARAAWLRKAGVIAAHREDTGWSNPDRAIGAMPGMTHTERRATYAAAWDALGQPAAGLDDAALTDGQLRIRVRARELELAWAPPHADAALRAASLAAENARQSAAITRAEAEQATQLGEHDRASQLLTEAARHDQDHAERAAAAAALDRAATARAQWAAAAAPTLDAGDRASAEADRRGLDLNLNLDPVTTQTTSSSGPGPQPVSAQEWWAAEQEARIADDAHRAITETDLSEPDLIDSTRAGITQAGITEPDTDDTTSFDAAHGEQEADQTTDHLGPVSGESEPSTLPRLWGGHAVVPEDITSSELETMAAATALVTARITDRASQDQAAPATDVADARAVESYEAGRRRRDAASEAAEHSAAASQSDELTAGDE